MRFARQKFFYPLWVIRVWHILSTGLLSIVEDSFNIKPKHLLDNYLDSAMHIILYLCQKSRGGGGGGGRGGGSLSFKA